jgi:hypothetical protein
MWNQKRRRHWRFESHHQGLCHLPQSQCNFLTLMRKAHFIDRFGNWGTTSETPGMVRPTRLRKLGKPVSQCVLEVLGGKHSFVNTEGWPGWRHWVMMSPLSRTPCFPQCSEFSMPNTTHLCLCQPSGFPSKLFWQLWNFKSRPWVHCYFTITLEF